MQKLNTDMNMERFMFHLLKYNPGLSQTYQMFRSLSHQNASMTTGNKCQTSSKPIELTTDETNETLLTGQNESHQHGTKP